MSIPPISISVEDIYGTPEPKIPEGYEAVGLIKCGPNRDEIVLGCEGKIERAKIYYSGLPRLELRKKPALVTWEIQVPEGQEPVCFANVGHRIPKAGEFVLVPNGAVVRADWDFYVECKVVAPIEARKVK